MMIVMIIEPEIMVDDVQGGNIDDNDCKCDEDDVKETHLCTYLGVWRRNILIEVELGLEGRKMSLQVSFPLFSTSFPHHLY